MQFMPGAETIPELLRHGRDENVAILAPGRSPLTYARLRDQAAQVVDSMRAHGIGRSGRVALVLPNGPEAATAFVSVAAGAAVAPLNPSYRPAEFEFSLSDLRADALIVLRGQEAAAVAVAGRIGLPVIELQVEQDAPAGTFSLPAPAPGVESAPDRGASPNDLALLLHTSGTTSRPKLVPLTQQNLCASARHVGDTLQLVSSDRCLNLMPLFHIHGLIAAVLASLAAGAAVACPPGFNALRFFSWMREIRPTWYTAVPTMHQLLLARADRHAGIIGEHPLRFIRSSSASLAPTVMAELEAVFGAPVVESYGMTEAAHQMASNPLPPGPRKPGTVGTSAGPEVAVMDPEGTLLKVNEVGEIVIRGPSVTRGYENNPQANAEAYCDGWFRTGDLGSFDEEGYLTISGRLKEIINRGGEKIGPREVEEVLLEHPAVAEAAAFAVPHAKLGEDVAAAVVLCSGAVVGAEDLRAHAAKRLATFKVPRRLIVLDEIPKGPTGKVQRSNLARRLGLAHEAGDSRKRGG